MRTLALILATLFCVIRAFFAEELTPFTINLKHPMLKNGVISTDQGGVVTSSELRIQARHLEYTHRSEKNRMTRFVVAQGDLALIYKDQIYLGHRLEYDFLKKRGVIYQGITAFRFFFVGGEKIWLGSSGGCEISKAFITTSDHKKIDWKIQARNLAVDQNRLLTADSITARLFDTPIFWFPRFKMNLSKPLIESPVRYKVEWKKGVYPVLSARYLFYAQNANQFALRLSLHPLQGFGVALESDYTPPDKKKGGQTKSYIGRNGFYHPSFPHQFRYQYRFQGFYETRSQDRRSHLYFTYDKLSDQNMQSEFLNPDFERSTVRPTFLNIRNDQEKMILGLDLRPRINSFESMKQELPSLFLNVHPFIVKKSKLISNNLFQISNLNYLFAKELKGFLQNFRSRRLETKNELYLPLFSKGVSLTPLVGFRGIFYDKSQKGGGIFQTFLYYKIGVEWALKKEYLSFKHVFRPYIDYKGVFRPMAHLGTPYIFDINDGYHRLNELRGGMRHSLYLKKFPLFEPNFAADLYFISFLSSKNFKKGISKIQGSFEWNFPTVLISSQLGWNMEKQVCDFANAGLSWTINRNFAFKTELRHRGLFDYRCCDRGNYFLEVARSTLDLLDSPLSDRRNSHLTRLEIRFIPDWTLRLESYVGWGRKKEPGYHKFRLELVWLISTNWKLRIVFAHAPTPDKKSNPFSFGFSINQP